MRRALLSLQPDTTLFADRLARLLAQRCIDQSRQIVGRSLLEVEFGRTVVNPVRVAVAGSVSICMDVALDYAAGVAYRENAGGWTVDPGGAL